MDGTTHGKLDAVARLAAERRLGTGDKASFFTHVIDENASDPRSSTTRMRAGIEPLPTRTASGRKPITFRSPPRSSSTPIRVPAISTGPVGATGSVFMAGDPMKPATNRFAGAW
jgi:hypothetical protein